MPSPVFGRWQEQSRRRGHRREKIGVHFCTSLIARCRRASFHPTLTAGLTARATDTSQGGNTAIFLGGRSEAQLQRYLLAHKWPTFSLPFAGTANWMR
jgi:hypothetical protein